jgi:GNAT superfamily N-acetyltransferase
VSARPPDIVTATNRDLPSLGYILGDAFSDDPCMNWVIPHSRLYPAFFRLLAKHLYLRHELVFLDAEKRAAAMWLPPGVTHKLPVVPTKFWLLLRLLAHSGTGVLTRIEQAQKVMARHHPRTPHYYLQAIGVRRLSQGQGLGSVLLKHTTAICDRAQMPAYLESSTPRNVPLYQRHGFEVIAEEPIGDGGPPMFFMWREARQ